MNTELYAIVDKEFNNFERGAIKQLTKQGIYLEYDYDGENPKEIIFIFTEKKKYEPTTEQNMIFRHLLEKINKL